MVNATLIGTGGMLPLPNRWLTSFWLEYQGKACLIDCGEGTQIAISEHNLKLSHLDTILLTHAHADHIAGLPGLLLTLGNIGNTDIVTIYGHNGISDTLRQLLCICPLLPFRVEIRELSTDEISHFEWNGFTVSSLPMMHRVSCLGYSFTLNRPPVFAPQKAQALGVDVKYWKSLHAGGSVEIDGRIITTEMVTDGQRKPIKVTYMTDSLFFEDMIPFAENSDLLVCEGMYGDDSYLEKMREKKHMVFSQSARVARESHSSLLWLTHYSPALVEPKDYTDYMKGLFENTVISSDGETTVLR